MKFALGTTLLFQSASAANWSWGWCGWNPPETNVKDFNIDSFTGQWYEIQRDNNLKPWKCVTQEIQHDYDDEDYPLRIDNYINGNKVIQSEKAEFDEFGQGKTRMLSKSKRVTVFSASEDLMAEDAHALLYSCATDWWLLFPRKTENTWVIAR